MPFTIIDPDIFIDNAVFSEDSFMGKIDLFDWSAYQDKKVLVRGCGSTIIPPWTFMVITGHLTPYAKSIRYGNEHDNLVVFRRKSN